MLKNGRTNVHDEERSSRPSVVSDLVQSVDQKICERRRFTVSELSYEFPQTSRTLPNESITVRLGCLMFAQDWFLNCPRVLQNGENGFVFDFF
jgi:hypothetical protein